MWGEPRPALKKGVLNITLCIYTIRTRHPHKKGTLPGGLVFRLIPTRYKVARPQPATHATTRGREGEGRCYNRVLVPS